MAGLAFFDTSECGWADVRVHANGVRIRKIRGIKFGVKVDKEWLYAEGVDPFEIKSGNKEFPAELKLLKGACDDLNDAAVAAGGDDATDISLDITISFRPKGSRKVRVYTLRGFEITEFNYEMMQGDKQMEVTLPAMFLGLKAA